MTTGTKISGIEEAQKRLDEKRALLKQTAQEQTSSADDGIPACDECRQPKTRLEIFDRIFWSCKPCDEKRAAEEAEQERFVEINRQEAKKKEKMLKHLASCGIGERFKGMAFEDYKPTCEKAAEILQECRKYVDSFHDRSGTNLLIIGSPGTGKNMLAAIIGQELIKKEFSCIHTTAVKLVRSIKDTWRNKEQREQETIDYFSMPSLLIIDEIGVQFGSPTEQLYLTEVINDRYEKRASTILISNLKLSQLTEIMGERIIDRFYDDGSKFLVFDWASYRRQK